jgi:primosomal protein N''
LQLRDNQENLQARFDRHLQNFDENQRTTNAALEQLTAILLRLTRNDIAFPDKREVQEEIINHR